MEPPPPPPRERRLIDPQVWKACAGTAAKIPAPGTSVYYFPQGHAEQASSAPDFSSISVRLRLPFHRCLISSVSLLADEATDEVFAKFLLDPRPPPSAETPSAAAVVDSVMSFSKVLTPSDANNGGGFSVPRYCADWILPPLDYNLSPPCQNITIHDVHGTPWEFRHIYRGMPHRHLLTTGWSKFVNSKNIVAGDSVIFMKNEAGKLLVGIRRAVRSFGGCPYGPAEEKTRPEMVWKDGFTRNVKSKVSPESVLEAVRQAVAGKPFEVVYYPRTGLPDFVVDAETVKAATRVSWDAGTRIKMWVDTDVSTMTQGKVCGRSVFDPVLWPNSPWRMLQVNLEEPKAIHTRNVNPWQVELASTTFHLQSSYPSLKRLKPSPILEQPTNIYHPVAGYNNLVVADLAPPLVNYNNTPVGIQGARQNSSSESNVSNSVPVFKTVDNSVSKSSSVSTPKQPNNVSIELSVGSTTQSDSSSPCTQSNFSGERRRSVKLFGRLIQIDQHSNSDVGKENIEVKAEVDHPSTNHL